MSELQSIYSSYSFLAHIEEEDVYLGDQAVRYITELHNFNTTYIFPDLKEGQSVEHQLKEEDADHGLTHIVKKIAAKISPKFTDPDVETVLEYDNDVDVSVEYQTTATINFVEDNAGYTNTVGFYTLGEDGTIENASVLFSQDNKSVGESKTVDIPGNNTDFGMFLIADGFDKNKQYKDIDFTTDQVKFIYDLGGDNERAAQITDSAKDVSLIVETASGITVLKGNVYHTTLNGENTQINPDGKNHAISGLADPDDPSTLRIGFEDLKNLGDQDFNDAILDIKIASREVDSGEVYLDDKIYAGVGEDIIVGGEGSDELRGGADNDYIDGGAGDDVLAGDAGDDVIFGGDGNDQIHGGDGHDELHGDDGDDFIRGGDGNDTMHGGADNDDMRADAGDDTVHGGDGEDQLYGGDGHDQLFGGAGNDIVRGEAGDDILEGGDGDDDLRGGDDDDVVRGGNGNDYIYGDDGADQLYGDDGADVIHGGGGDDHLDGGIGQDKLYGGDGNDTLDGGDGNDFLSGDLGDDTITGGAGADELRGAAGNDALYGGDDNDVLFGGNGDDIISGDGGYDRLYGNAGADTFVFKSGTAFDARDQIYDFNAAEGDKIDITDLLEDFDPVTEAITDFVKFGTNGTHSYLKVDMDGADGPGGFADVAQITRVTGLDDVDQLVTDGTLIV